MDIFSTTTVPMPAQDLPIDMFSPMPVSQWLPPLPLTSSFSACQQPPSPLQLSSPCTPSGSNSRSSGFTSTSSSYPVDPYYGQPMQDNYQQIFDDYSSVSYQPTSPYFNCGLSPETHIARFLGELSNSLKQADDKDFSTCQEMWKHFVCEFFDDGVLFAMEVLGGGEKERYVLHREQLPGFLHTYAEARMCNMQCALGQGHMTQHEDLLRMDFSNATCLIDCVKTNLVKVVREGHLIVDMKAVDNLKIKFWYFKINKYNEFILRDTLQTKDDSEPNLSACTASGVPPEAYAYLKKHGQSSMDRLDELLLSPVSTNPTTTFLTPDNNWLLGADPYATFDTNTCTTYSNVQPKMLPFPPFPSGHDQVSSSDPFVLPKNPIKSRHSSWSASSSSKQHNNKLKKQKSNGPKGKKRHRPTPIVMYIAGDPLTLHRDGRLLKGISDAQERKITCIKNIFESLKSDQEPKRVNPTTSKNSRIIKPILKINTTLSKSMSSYQNTAVLSSTASLLSSSSSSWTDTLKLLNNNDVRFDQRQLCS